MNGAPGPSAFPWVMLALLAVLSLVLFFRSGSRENEKPKDSLKEAMFIFGAMALYFVLVPVIGFLVGTFVGITLFLRITVKSWPKCLITAGLTAAVLYVLFKVIFHISLPSGFLPF